MNSYLSILNTKTEILRVTFFTFRPKYDNYSETRSFKKFSFINLVRYESSNEYFTRNADSLTFKKSGVYYFYYVDKIIPIDRGNPTEGYLEVSNSTNPFHKNKYSNSARDASQVQQAILEFSIYIEANNEIKIKAIDVERFGDDNATNHSVKDENTFLLIKKNLLSNCRWSSATGSWS